MINQASFFKNTDDITRLLFAAVSTGDLAFIVENLPSLAVNDYKDKRGYTLLHCAAKAGRLAIAEYLLKHGANVNAVNPMGGVITLIPASVSLSNAATIKDGAGQTPLHLAVEAVDSQMVELLLDYGADTEISDADYFTPLHYAIFHDTSVIVDALLQAGANIHAISAERCSIFHSACERANVEILRLLIGYGADVNSTRGKFGKETPLHVAMYHNNFPAVKLLLESNVDISIVDAQGRTALATTEYKTFEDYLYYNSFPFNLSQSCQLI